MPIVGDQDLYLFNEGTHARLYEKLGAHLTGGGAQFAVWAPNAASVSVIGDFNDWEPGKTPLAAQASSGIWAGQVDGVSRGTHYKLHIRSHHNGYEVAKADPFGFMHQCPPQTASIIWDLDYDWGDTAWMAGRHDSNALSAPMSIYEMHVGAWRHHRDGHSYDYRELAEPLADYVAERGFTHIELLPVTEYPFYDSWGYQVTGYFAPTNRFGTPQELMYLIDVLHQRGIGVILDWVPAHFPSDEHGLGYFDGTHLFEHADPRRGYHPDWNTLIYNYGRNEVRAFLISSAVFWLDKYHIDGLRVDGVASMLYLDYSRNDGEWIPNQYGGRENLEAIDFIKQFNATVYREFPDVQTIAEESTAWPMVSHPTDTGGLGFGLKWDMGWMHDTLKYMQRDPLYRRHHQNQITFRSLYAFNENFVLPLSHDEVVHGKGSLIEKMPGDDWQKFANLRALYAYMFATPGKKLLFMGGEIAQRREWNHNAQLDWELLDLPAHRGVQALIDDLNRLYREVSALHQLDAEPGGFSWLDASDADHSVLSFARKGDGDLDIAVAVFNLTPVPRDPYRIPVPIPGSWELLLNTDDETYGGSGYDSVIRVEAEPLGDSQAIDIKLPPLSAMIYLPTGAATTESGEGQTETD